MIVIGFFLVPYFAFFLGKMHLFAVDQLPEGFKVKEMRVSLDHVNFVKTDNSEVWATGSSTFTLCPGATRIHVGIIDLPAGSYIGRNVYLSSVSVDVEADISKLKDPMTGESPPPENYQTVYDNFKTVFGYSFKLRFPTGSSSNWSALDRSKFTFTMTTGPFQEFQSDPTQVMTYPGFGGPDITLDFTLSEDGTVTVTPILDFPPGMVHLLEQPADHPPELKSTCRAYVTRGSSHF